MRTASATFLSELVTAVGPANVLTDPDVVAGYCSDWTGRFTGDAPAVVRPGSTDEVAAVVSACRREGVALVPQGGNTGLVGGGVPLNGEVVLSLRRLTSVGPVDPDVGQLTAGAGATLAAIHAAAADADWAYGVDFSSRDSATAGGSIATNAGGTRVLRHGDTRAQVLGVEAVLGSALVISHLGGLLKDNTGYHLPSLLCGSEGTLGVITAARLRLVPRVDERVSALLGFASVDAALAAATALWRDVASLDAVELLLADGLRLVCDRGMPAPFPCVHQAYLLVEAADRHSPLEPLGDAVASLDGVADVAVAVDPARRAELWRYRDGLAEAINTLGPPHKMDVTLPRRSLSPFLASVPGLVARVAPTARTWLFGHVVDGNIHVNVTGLPPGDLAVDVAVLGLVAELGGSISGEHGIGTAKRDWLELGRSPAEIAAFRALKRALDPDGILNPNVLLPRRPPLG